MSWKIAGAATEDWFPRSDLLEAHSGLVRAYEASRGVPMTPVLAAAAAKASKGSKKGGKQRRSSTGRNDLLRKKAARPVTAGRSPSPNTPK